MGRYANKTELAGRLQLVMTRALNVPPETPPAKLVMGDLKAWDSLNHVLMMMEIESAFDIEISSQDLPEWTSFAIVLDGLAAMLGSEDGEVLA